MALVLKIFPYANAEIVTAAAVSVSLWYYLAFH